MRLGSIFNVFAIGNGPSSSHSIGPYRAARYFREALGAIPARCRVTLYGSLALTGKGHFTDRAVSEGLQSIPHEIVWDEHASLLPHPNTMRFEAFGPDGSLCNDWLVWSIGGGNLEDSDGPVDREENSRYPVESIQQAIETCESGGMHFWNLVARQEGEIWQRLEHIWEVMRESVKRGLESEEVYLPGPLRVERRAKRLYRKADMQKSPYRDITLLSAFPVAVAEENAAGGMVAAAPTCGSSGVVPGLLYYLETEKQIPRADIIRALATAGLFGSAIRTNGSISGAEVGCQGEIGSACSMAAAACSQILGGTLRQIESAAEMAMEHHLGLTCDPVQGYVQIPCIERNIFACLRAFECATISVSDTEHHLVDFDTVIRVMCETGKDLRSEYRETSTGGLSRAWNSRVNQAGSGASTRMDEQMP